MSMKAYSSYTVVDVVDGIQWQADATSHPVNPKEGWAYYNTADKCSYLYDGTKWVVFARDGEKGGEGDSITEEITQYYQWDSCTTLPPADATDWMDTFPSEWDLGNPYIWKRIKQTWKQNGKVEIKHTAPQLMSQLEVATIMAQKVEMDLGDWCVANNVTLIDGSAIATGSITADKIDVDDLNAFEATIGGWEIAANGLYKDSTKLLADDGIVDSSLVYDGHSPIRLAIGAMNTREFVYNSMVSDGGTIDQGIDFDEGIIKSISVISCTDELGDNFGNFGIQLYEDGMGFLFFARHLYGPYDGLATLVVKITYIDTSKSEEEYNFRVLEDGSLYANAANIKGTVYATDGEFNGTIYASGGTIGGWKLEDYNERTKLLYSKGTDGVSCGMAAVTYPSDPVFWAGYTGTGDHPWNRNQGEVWKDFCDFSILRNGMLRAKNADVEGNITATEGYIGKLKISGGGLLYQENNSDAYSLNNSGLILEKSSAKIKVGDLTLQYNDDNETTLIETTGHLALRGQNGAQLEFMKDDSDASAESYVELYFRRTSNSNDAEVWVKSTVAPLYPIVFDVPWQAIQYKILTGNKVIDSGIVSITLEAGETTSKRVSMSYSMYADQGVQFHNYNDTDYYWSNLVENTSEPQSPVNTVGYFSQTTSAKNLYVTGDLLPSTKSTSEKTGYNLGSSNYLWNTVYARTSSINTSDRNKKNTIQPLSEAYEQIFDSLKPVSYKFNVSNNNRTHIGLIAQDVKESIENAGLTTQDFAGYCEWTDEEGNVGCGLRYSEFIALTIDQTQKLKQRVTELEERIALLEQYINKESK